jgi:hypothetical protein
MTIKKTHTGYEVISHKTGRRMGIYPSRAKAVMRLKQLKAFSKMRENKNK